MIDTKALHDDVCELAAEVGTFLASERRRLDGVVTAESKGVHDYVTRFDKESERRIVERLHRLLPDGGFIAEEGTATTTGRERYAWIVDPLDGTTNYIHGFAPTCVSIGLQDRLLSDEQRRPVMVVGVVYEMWAHECFSACAARDGSFLNGNAIGVSQARHMDDALLATGFPYSDFSRMRQYMELLEWTMRHSHGVRRLGSAAADLVYTACGRVDGFYEYGLKSYDVAAGAYIVEKAGGKNSDFGGGHNWLFGGEMVSSNAAIYDEFIACIKRFLNVEK